MRVIVIAIITLAAILQSTAQKSEIKNGVEYVTFTRDDFKTSSKLIGERIEFDSALDPMTIHFLNDTLILSIARGEQFHHGEVYNLKTGKLVVKCIPKGRGPSEILSFSILKKRYDRGCFDIVDRNYDKFATFNVDSMLTFGIGYKPRLRKLIPCISDVTIDRDGGLICKNFMNTFNDYFVNDVFAFCKYQDQNSVVSSGKVKYGAPRSNDGLLFSSIQNNEYILAMSFFNEIQFWNSNLKKCKVLSGPGDYKPDWKFNKNRGRVYINNEKRTYVSATFTKDRMYIGYLFKTWEEKRTSSEIFVFDWSGGFIHRYEVDKYIKNIYIDENGEYLYGVYHNNRDYYPELYRFRL